MSSMGQRHHSNGPVPRRAGPRWRTAPRSYTASRSYTALIWLALWLSACGVSALERAALQSDLPALRREFAAAKQRDALDGAEVRRLARRVAERELASNTGDAAVQRIRDLRGCVWALRGAFEDLAKGATPAAAAAQLALIDASVRVDRAALVEAYAAHPDPMWRAVGARAMTHQEHQEVRRERFLDGDLRVRRAALHAVLEAPLAGDAEALLETARLDPDALTRSLAIRALGKLGSQVVVQRLRDLWTRADAETRQVIVGAWATPTSRRNGGLERLRWVAETQGGLPRVVAAVEVVRHDGERASLGLGVLARVIEAGPVDEQRLAMRLAPQLEPLIGSYWQVAQGSDAHAQVMAAAALSRLESERPEAVKLLHLLLDSKSEDVARQARAALAALGESSVVPSLIADLRHPAPVVRGQAATQLLWLDQPVEAATGLLDPHAWVRTHTACAILAPARTRAD